MSAHLTLITKLIKDAQIVIRVVGNAFLAIGLTAVLMLCQTACAPLARTEDSQNASTQEGLQVTDNPTGMAVGTDPSHTQLFTPGSQQVTPEVAETSLPTNTPEPSPTPRPHYDINDLETWPKEMQDYFNRAPEEWNNPTRQYMSNEAFDQFIQQSRRDFLSELGIDGVEGMSREELFTEYVRWGMEDRQLITLSPQEKINISTGSYVLYYHDPGVVGQGMGYDLNISHTINAQEVLDYITYISQMTTHLFGDLVDYARPGNLDMIGSLVGVVRPTGTRAEQAADCLVYYEQEGQGYWAIVAVSFTPETHLAGEEFVALDYGFKTYFYQENFTGLSLKNAEILTSRVPVSQQELLDHLGNNLWFKMGAGTVLAINAGQQRVSIELTAAGLEKAYGVIFNIPQPPDPILPWD